MLSHFGEDRGAGWWGENIKHRTPNVEHRSEEARKKRTKPLLERLHPDLPVAAIEVAVEEKPRTSK